MWTSSSESQRRRCCIPALLLTALWVSGCIGLTPDEERRIGAQLAQQTRGELLFLRDAVVVDYVRDIGARLVRAAGPQTFEFHFQVVEDDEINAFAAPGGYVYVNSGTILQARNVSELAAVLAHEIGHVSLRHISDNYARQRGASTAQTAVVTAASVFGYGGLASLGSGLATMAVLNQFSQEAESEADVFAVDVMPRAGYDPEGLVTFLQVVRQEEQRGGAPTFLSSHPATGDRIQKASALVAAEPRPAGLQRTDGGRFEIIQRRIELLTRKVRPAPGGRSPL